MSQIVNIGIADQELLVGWNHKSVFVRMLRNIGEAAIYGTWLPAPSL